MSPAFGRDVGERSTREKSCFCPPRRASRSVSEYGIKNPAAGGFLVPSCLPRFVNDVRAGDPACFERYSNVFDAVRHLFWLVRFPDKKQIHDDLTDASAPLGAERETSMFHARRMEPQEIRVLGEDDSARGDAVGDVLFVPGMEQARFGCGRDVDAVEAKAYRDGRVAVLIEVEAYRP